MNQFLQEIPILFVHFLLTGVFAFIVGLEQRKQHPEKDEMFTFGTDRTFVFISLLGFVLLVADPVNRYPLHGRRTCSLYTIKHLLLPKN